MKKTNLTIMLIGLSLMMLTACKPPTKSGVRTYTTNENNNATGTGGTAGIPACAAYTAATGSVYDAQGNTQFEQRVKSFLSATMDPSEVGSISPGYSDSTGIRFNIQVAINRQNGQVILERSAMKMAVYDSYFLTGQAQPIPVGPITGAIAGQFNLQTGVGSVTFRDNYGTIKFEGKIDSQFATGVVTYVNTTTVVSGGTPAQGTLGDFKITTCGMIQ